MTIPVNIIISALVDVVQRRRGVTNSLDWQTPVDSPYHLYYDNCFLVYWAYKHTRAHPGMGYKTRSDLI